MRNISHIHPTRRPCLCCGYRFKAKPGQVNCQQCQAYIDAGQHLTLAARLLKGVR